MPSGNLILQAQLIEGARNALRQLFAAYNEERNREDLLIAQVKRELNGESLGVFEAVLRQSQRDTVHALAGCIALVADNVARNYARDTTGDENVRRRHGRIIRHLNRNITTFGNLLWVAANAARHYAGTPFYRETENIISAFSISERDESVPFKLFEISKVNNEDDLENDLHVLCGGINASS